MEKKTRVALYGGDLVVSTIGVILERRSGFEVLRIEGDLPDDVQGMGSSRPDVILFDLATTHPPFGVSLMYRYPEILLIGIDLTRHTMLVLSGTSSRLSTIEDLMERIEKRHSQQRPDR